MSIEYYYLNPFVKYNEIFEQLGCKKGNKNELLRVIKLNPKFCRNQKAINLDYLIESISQDVVIYITDGEGTSYNNYIVGAATVYINSRYNNNITITGICVPFSSDKKYGTLLLNMIKNIGTKIGSKQINLAAKDSNADFYLKNGFIINKRYLPEIRSRSSDKIDYDLDMSYTLNKTGGKKRKTYRKRNNKSKTRKNLSKH